MFKASLENNNMQSYYAAFRQYLNMTPKEYRAFSRAQMLAQKTD